MANRPRLPEGYTFRDFKHTASVREQETATQGRSTAETRAETQPLVEEVEFHNDAERPLFVPGFNGLPVSAELPLDERFSHGSHDWFQWPNLTARELAMLHLIDAITEKTNWHIKVFDDDIMLKWRQEAQLKPLISNAAWDWCVAELQDKALQFRDTGSIVVLNTGCGVFKSDMVISPELQSELKKNVEDLLNVPECEKDWHPGSDRQVLNLVHPSLFPLVYGRTRVLDHGGYVDRYHAFESYGLGTIAPTHDVEQDPMDCADWADRAGDLLAKQSEGEKHFWQQEIYSQYRYSPDFQWLPFEVQFASPSNTDVHISSYINNLHPVKHYKLYGTIEKLISASIVPWNQILVKGGRARWPLRIRTWGAEWQPERPDLIDRLRDHALARTDQAKEDLLREIEDYLSLKEDFPAERGYIMSRANKELSNRTADGTWRHWSNEWVHIVSAKWKRLKHWVHPEPGVSFDYKQWKDGDTSNAIIERISRQDPEAGPEDIYPDHSYYDVKLQDTFAHIGLQVHVKISSIELTPEKPYYPGGNWHVEGMVNEHIVATSIYYYDVDNVTKARIAFRQETRMDEDEFVYTSSGFDDIGAIFAVPGVEKMLEGHYNTGYPSLQDLGSVITQQGRLLAWPNTLQHCVEPFELADKTRPGHRRFVVLWLVDPHYRICSTQNVPPQQYDWWKEQAFATVDFENRNIPQEVIDLVEDNLDEWPMGLSEAKRLRRRLMAERTTVGHKLAKNTVNSYNFCEH